MRIYGYINENGCLVDTGLTSKGAKKVASIVGAKQMGYRIDYHVTITHTKVGLYWRPVSSMEGKTATYKTKKMRKGIICHILKEFPKTVKIGFMGKVDFIKHVNKKSIVV